MFRVRHIEALRTADKELATERDRRYAEVAAARAEALKIKEEADKVALGLARENQKLKEAQHNDVLNQWKDERGNYATKAELGGAIKELHAGRRISGLDGRALLFSLIGAGGILWAVLGGPHP